MPLPSVLGRRDVFALAFGAIVGWGWVVLSGPMIDQAGSLGSIVAVGIAAAVMALVGLTYAELTAALPRAGGEVAFTYLALGRGWSWICGWSLVLAYVGVCAFEAVALATVSAYLLPALRAGALYSIAGADVYAPWIAIGVAGALFVGLVNLRGMTTSAGIQRLAVGGLLAVGLAFFSGAALFGEPANLQPWFSGTGGVFRVLILMPFLFVGFDVIPQAAEEMRVPMRQVGSLMLLSIGIAAGWYALIQWGVGVSLPPALHRASELPTADAAARLAGTVFGGHLLVLGGLLGILTSWNAFFVGGTRLLYGMGRAGMLPGAFARLSDRFGTPSAAILLVTTCSAMAPFLGRQALVWLANACSFATVLAYALTAIAFVRLRRTAPALPRPYRVAAGGLIGPAAVLSTLAFALLYLPPSPSALAWPYEWGILISWALFGVIVFARVRGSPGWADRAAQARALMGEVRAAQVGRLKPAATGHDTERPPSGGRTDGVCHDALALNRFTDDNCGVVRAADDDRNQSAIR